MRNKQWKRMIGLAEAGILSSKPRVALGDFNDIKSNEEKNGGPKRAEYTFNTLRRMLNATGLHELKTIEGNFTWIGKRKNYTVQSKMDRAVAMAEWQDLFPRAYVQLLDWIGSDHKPLILHTGEKKWKRIKLFRYDNRWRFNKEIKKEISNLWEKKCMSIPGPQLHIALKRCRLCLARWKSKTATNSAKKIEELKNLLEKADGEEILQHTRPIVTEEMNKALIKPFTEKELLKALQQMDREKAPGPDGLNPGFFKDQWSSVGKVGEDLDIIKTVRPAVTNARDFTTWIHTKDGYYSVKSGNLRRRKIQIEDTCQSFGEESETVNHMLFHCRISKEIWNLAPTPVNSDASWTSSEEKAGIGWALYNKDAKLVLHGKAAIEPIGSPLEADAEALHMAVSQIKRVGFHPVTFCGGSAMLYKQLPQHKELVPMVPKPMSLSCPTYTEYIDNLIKEGKASFSFQKVPRSCNTQADNLAREGRMKNLNYVVCWNLYKTRPI